METTELFTRWLLPFYTILLLALAWSVFKEHR